MVESSPSRQRRPPCQTNKGMSDEAANAAALTYLLTYARDDKTNELYVNAGVGITGRGELVPWGWLETK